MAVNNVPKVYVFKHKTLMLNANGFDDDVLPIQKNIHPILNLVGGAPRRISEFLAIRLGELSPWTFFTPR